MTINWMVHRMPQIWRGSNMVCKRKLNFIHILVSLLFYVSSVPGIADLRLFTLQISPYISLVQKPVPSKLQSYSVSLQLRLGVNTDHSLIKLNSQYWRSKKHYLSTVTQITFSSFGHVALRAPDNLGKTIYFGKINVKKYGTIGKHNGWSTLQIFQTCHYIRL